jgi:uncharacterized protein (TIGR00661 family)
LNPIQKIDNKTILLSPLDWGFGHTTRCVSIIRILLANNNKVIFAGNKAQVNFISHEFPALKTEFIDGYNITLSSKKSTYIQIYRQTIKIVKAIKKETDWVKKYISKHNIDLIISDNRYGFRHSNIESIFISHQLNLHLPIFKKIVNHRLASHINNFNEAWIPDDEKLNLSGSLSKSKLIKIGCKEIGLLSRFNLHKETIIYDYLFIVSGPSPENSIFLNKIEQTIQKTKFKIAIVSSVKSKTPHLRFDFFYLPSSLHLNQIINQSSCVVSKSGYTTIMEMVSINKKAILIPTRGQFEQEYLAQHIRIDHLDFIESISQLRVD